MLRIAAVLRFVKISGTIAVCLCTVPHAGAEPVEKTFVQMLKKHVVVRAGDADTEILAKTKTALDALHRMDLPRASRNINEALQLAPRNSHLHFLNSFIYHLQAKQGDSEKTALAIEGYQQALRIDPSNWIAQEFLGLAYLDLRHYDQAKVQFSEVLLMTPDSTLSVNGLMVASYLTGDAITACVMADQLKNVSSERQLAFVRSAVSVYASCGAFAKAEAMYEELKPLAYDRTDIERVGRRLAQWKAFYRNQADAAGADDKAGATKLINTSLGGAAQDVSAVPVVKPIVTPNGKSAGADQAFAAPVVPPAEPTQTDKEAAGTGTPRMVLVDVVLVSTQEFANTSKGVNLLSALTLQLGSVAGNAPAYSKAVANAITNGAESVTTSITRALTVPALSYSLNIANSNNSINEVLARPTLAAVEGKPSEFFSGTNLSAGVVSVSPQGGPTIVPIEKRFGIKLAVTPVFVSQNKVQMKVEAQRTALNANVDQPRVAYQIETGEITANANVVMDIGETLVLSGFSEKASAATRDGVPFLQDVPVIQYMFSQRKTTDVHRSVLILLTPRAILPNEGRDETAPSRPTSGNAVGLRQQFGLSDDLSRVDAALARLKAHSLFREFREGDISVERWERKDSTGERLRQSLQFLYY
jgi:tetratricopeptide (TPR) repeat protein